MKVLTKQHIAKVLLLVGGTATVAESCNPDRLLYTQQDFAKDDDCGPSLIPVKLYVDDNVNVAGILKFVNDVLSVPSIREDFSKTPNAVLAEYGLGSFDRDDPQMQILMAMADKDIQQSIEEKDFTKYLSLLERKDLLQSDVIKQVNVLLRDDDIKNKVNLMTKSDIVSEDPGIIVGGVVVAAVVVVTVALWVAVGVQVAAGVQWAAAIQALAEVHAAVHFATCLWTNGGDVILPEDTAIELFIDSSKDINTFEITEEEYVTQIREFMLDSEELNGRNDVNTLFQLACGTTENILSDGE